MSSLASTRCLCTVVVSLCLFPAMMLAGDSAAKSQAPPPPPTYSVVYTGRLFGYFRYPEVQDKDMAGCPSEEFPTKENAPEARIFLNLRDLMRPGAPLVGVGDNFAPFLLARRVWDLHPPDDWNPWNAKKQQNPNQKKQQMGALEPKEEFGHTFGTINRPKLPSDNVACFLRLAHFTAVVPGKHDFYFGPQRLRDLAGILSAPRVPMACPPELRKEGQPEPNCDYMPVRMLGANLSLKVQRTDTPGQDGGSGAAPSSGTKDASPHLALPKVVLPWMRFLYVVGNIQSPSILVCKDHNKPPEPCAQGGIMFDLVPDTKPRQYRMQADQEADEVLKIGTKYNVFADGKLLGNFRVTEPFFNQEKERPWVMTKDKTLAIFGVVDQNLEQLVGRLNYTWLGLKKENAEVVDSSYETVVEVSDPAEALNQALQKCFYHPECKQARKLLLAQMSQASVYQDVLPRLDLPAGATAFDLVIAEGDPDRGSGRFETVVDDPPGPAVLVPGPHFPSTPASAYNGTVRLQVAQVSHGDGWREVDNRFELSDPIVSDPFNGCKADLNALVENGNCSNGHQVLLNKIRSGKQGTLAQDTPIGPNPQQPNPDWQSGLEDVGLRVMREACTADIAMLQHRDIFFNSNLVEKNFSPSGIAAALDAIFWAGDLIQCVSIPGSTISSILQHSAELKRQEELGLAGFSRGWAIAYSGVTPVFESKGGVQASGAGGGKSQWLVRGELLDPKRLYSVAITDFMANGDTGYPELKNAEPEPPHVPLADQRFWGFSDHMMAELFGTDDSRFRGREALDKKFQEKDKRPPNPAQDGFLQWAGSWKNIDAFAPPHSRDAFAFADQQEPNWFLRLYKADFSYALFQHNGNEGTIAAEFPGVTTPDLSGADSESFTADWQARLQKSWRVWETYMESDANWGRRNQRSKTSPFPYQPSQTANAWDVEAGFAHRLYPDHMNPSGLKFILPASMKSQLVRPYTQITPAGGKASGTPVSAPRNYYLAFRPGLRFEHNFPRQPGASGGGQANAAQAASSQGSKGGGGGSGQSSGGSGQAQNPSGQGQNQSSTLNSFIEAGFQAGEAYHSPSAFVFKNPGTPDPLCNVGGAGFVPVGDLVHCVNALGSTAQLTTVFANRNFYQQGVYLNFRFDAPVPARSGGEYILENRGDLFFNRQGDTAVDTRYLDDLKQSLLFPIYGKLSVGPSLELIFFKTKVTGNRYFSYATAISVNYSFDWHPGLNWPRVLGAGNSVTAPNPLPTK